MSNWYPVESEDDDEDSGFWGLPDEDGWIQLGRIVRVEPDSVWIPLTLRMPSDIEKAKLIVSCNQYTRQLYIGLDMRATHWAVLGDP